MIYSNRHVQCDRRAGGADLLQPVRRPYRRVQGEPEEAAGTDGGEGARVEER